MAYVLSSVSGNLISAASAGFAPTNSADVSAIASSYQVVSATGTQLYAGTAYLTSVNDNPISASRAGNAANASMANSAYYDGTGRLISALPDEAAVSAIASAYADSAASGKLDATAYDSAEFYTTSNPSGFVDATSASAIASAYQVVSSVGTSQNGPKSIVTGINGLFISARYADTANEARKDSSGRMISSLPDSAAVSAIASTYAESAASGKQDTLTFGYDAENKISSIDGSALAGGGGTTYTFDNPLKESAGVVSLDFDTDTLSTATTSWTQFDSFQYIASQARFRASEGYTLSDVLNYGVPWPTVSIHIPGNTYFRADYNSYRAYFISLSTDNYLNPTPSRTITYIGNPLATEEVTLYGATRTAVAEQDVVINFADLMDPELWTEKQFDFSGEVYLGIVMANSDTTIAANDPLEAVDNVSLPIKASATTAGPLTVKDPLPAHTSAESGKVLSVNASGGTEWVTPSAGGGGIDSATCSAIASAYAESAASSKQDALTFGYDTANAISSIDGSSLAGGGGGEADWSAESGQPGYIENKPVPKTLVAGAGITITENSTELVVASTNTLYNAGSGLSLNGTTFSVDTATVQGKITYDYDASGNISGIDGSSLVGGDPEATDLYVQAPLYTGVSGGSAYIGWNNETVLYNDFTGRPTNTGATISLNESPLNFQYVEVYLNGLSAISNSAGWANAYQKIDTVTLSSVPGLTFVGLLSGNSTWWDVGCAYAGVSGTTWTKVLGYTKQVNSTAAGMMDNVNHLNIWKVVGLNRTAGE